MRINMEIIYSKFVMYFQSRSVKFVGNSLTKGVNSCDLTAHRKYCKYTVPLGSDVLPKRNRNYLKTKIDDLVVWYEQLTGLDEVRFVQNRVIEAQDRLITAQHKRMESGKALFNVQNKLKDIYAELDTTTRGEERYLQLITQEHAILKEERILTEEFNQNEREERECFTFLSSAVKESHEKERAQAERTKYWSVIGSILGTVIGVLGSSINNQFKMRELKKMLQDSINSRNVQDTENHEMNQLTKDILSAIGDMKTSTHHQSDQIVNGTLLSLNNLQNSQNSDRSIEKMLEQQRLEMRVGILVVSAIAITLPVLLSFIQKFS